jgi:hypothetical protein
MPISKAFFIALYARRKIPTATPPTGYFVPTAEFTLKILSDALFSVNRYFPIQAERRTGTGEAFWEKHSEYREEITAIIEKICQFAEAIFKGSSEGKKTNLIYHKRGSIIGVINA